MLQSMGSQRVGHNRVTELTEDKMKLKSFCTAKEFINKMKRKHNKQEKISENIIFDKGLISKMYERLIQLHSKNQSESQSCSTPCNPIDCSCQAPLSMEFCRKEYWSG